MGWTIDFDHRAFKNFERLDKQDRDRISQYLTERVANAPSPRALGKPLVGSRFGELWRYRVGDYRLICQINDDQLLVLVVEVGHRSQVYRS